jgi:ethanolamine utilization protein EutN
MIIGEIVDQFFATQKHPCFEGHKLLLVQPLDLDGSQEGEQVIAIDGVDAGVGDRVLCVLDGWAAMKVLGKFKTPVNAAIIGVIDRIDLTDTGR